jgi:hypothetical protein
MTEAFFQQACGFLPLSRAVTGQARDGIHAVIGQTADEIVQAARSRRPDREKLQQPAPELGETQGRILAEAVQERAPVPRGRPAAGLTTGRHRPGVPGRRSCAGSSGSSPRSTRWRTSRTVPGDRGDHPQRRVRLLP